MHYYGVHIDCDEKNLIKETKKVKEKNGKIIQLFVNVSSDTARTYYTELNKYLKQNNMKCVVHASYTINCAQKWDFYSWWIKQFTIEIELANVLGAFGIVVHLGKQLDLTFEEAINNMYTSLLYVHNQTKQYKDVKILIETSTGQGSEICYKLENLSHLFRKFSTHKNKNISDRFGLCVDTCHIFAAGYDIRNISNIKMFIDQFDELIGLSNIKLLHLNDSKKDLGSKVDRHATIGYGFIGKESLKLIASMFEKMSVPIILETPYEHRNIDLQILLSK